MAVVLVGSARHEGFFDVVGNIGGWAHLEQIAQRERGLVFNVRGCAGVVLIAAHIASHVGAGPTACRGVEHYRSHILNRGPLIIAKLIFEQAV